MMRLKISPDMLINREHKTINSKIRIWIDCGSTLVLQNQKSTICIDCGNARSFLD